MKKGIYFVVMNGGFFAAVWLGFIEGVEGAQYVAKFFVWAVGVPFGLLVLTDDMQKRLAKEPRTPIRSAVARLVGWFALGVFVWYGHVITAAAWGFWMVAKAFAMAGAEKHRAELAAAPAAVP